MRNKQIHFFAVLDDLLPVLQAVETNCNLKYCMMGLNNEANRPEYQSITDIPSLSVASEGDWNRVESYLALKRNIEVYFRTVQQRNGSLMYAVDQLKNPNSIEIKPGGILKGKEIIIAGRIATTSDSLGSIELYSTISKEMKKVFKKIGGSYVGRIAEKKLNMGWRLATNINLPREHDLTIR